MKVTCDWCPNIEVLEPRVDIRTGTVLHLCKQCRYDLELGTK